MRMRKSKKRRRKPRSGYRVYRCPSPRRVKLGYLQLDGVIIHWNGQKHTFLSALEIKSRQAWAKQVPSLSSQQARLFLKEIIKGLPYQIHTIHTDNGSEFLGEFHRYTEENQIKHEFIYPRSPKINGVVERFNQTIQTEFIKRCDALYYDLDEFNQKLVRYLAWYNTRRPHYSLKFDTPANYLKKFI